MNKLEQLEQEAADTDVLIYNLDLGSRIKGLYCDGNIALSNKIDTSAEKACILAEELGHHHTTVGSIIDMTDLNNRKQEHQARLWAYNKQIGLHGLIDAYEHGCQTSHEISSHLEVTEVFLNEAIECYKQKYGICATLGTHVIYFTPHLMVGKKF